MNSYISSLEKKFIAIKNKGWIKTMRNGRTGVGYTFEQLLNKDEDTFPYPDFNGIEIKTKRKKSKYDITLFNLAPDGDFIFYKERILKYLGYPDRINKKYKVFNMSLKGNTRTPIGYYKTAKIIVDRENEIVKLIGYTNYGKMLDVNISWSFKLLKDRMNLKMKNMAIVLANSMMLGNIEYFEYETINFYKYIGFDAFLNLLEDGIISVVFKIGVYRSGEKEGHISDHGIGFTISLNNIEKLYYKIK